MLVASHAEQAIGLRSPDGHRDFTTRLPGHAPQRAIVVLGYHEVGTDGFHGISDICRAAVRRAERLAAEAAPRTVIFTGWSSTGGPSEAEQMADGWRGPAGVELICEPAAVNTAENAVRSLQLLVGLEGVSEVVVVCSVRHYPRARFFFDRLYRRHGYDVSYRYVARPAPSPRLVGSELGSIIRMLRDRRRALRLLDAATAPDHPPKMGPPARDAP